MAGTLFFGEAFPYGMANYCKTDGLVRLYCMGMPSFFKQGAKYTELTTFRSGFERFEPPRWANFILASQLGYTLGIWPWWDVFKSQEMVYIILSVLSAGTAGTCDAIGKEDKHNFMMSCRAKGVIIKPDVTIVPMDIAHSNNAQNADMPMLDHTKHNNVTANNVLHF